MRLSYSDYLAGTAQVLKASEQERQKYAVMLLDRQFIVWPGVFSPKYFTDTEFFARTVSKHLKTGEDFLEIGPGTGIILITAALSGAGRCVGIDINPLACGNAQENARLHGVDKQVIIRHGSLYEPLAVEEKFDVIFWNTPFGLVADKNLTPLEKAVFDPGYKSTRVFINQAQKHLKPKGRLLIGFSTTLGKYDLLQRFLKKTGFITKLLAHTMSKEIHPVSFELFEARLFT